MPPTLLVMAGGAIGAGFRYHVGRIALHQFGPGFPWGTWAINLSGGFLMGVLAGVLARIDAAEPWRLLVGVGILGGFTTFSAFSLETVLMIQRGETTIAVAYAVSSVVGSVLLLALGLQTTRVLA